MIKLKELKKSQFEVEYYTVFFTEETQYNGIVERSMSFDDLLVAREYAYTYHENDWKYITENKILFLNDGTVLPSKKTVMYKTD